MANPQKKVKRKPPAVVPKEEAAVQEVEEVETEETIPQEPQPQEPPAPKKVYPTREQILKAKTVQTSEVYVEELGGYIRLRELTADDRDRYDMFMFDRGQQKSPDDQYGMRAFLVYLCAVDPKGRRMFGIHDLRELGKKSYSALGKLYREAQRLSGLLPKAIEQAKEDFVDGQSSDSGTA